MKCKFGFSSLFNTSIQNGFTNTIFVEKLLKIFFGRVSCKLYCVWGKWRLFLLRKAKTSFQRQGLNYNSEKVKYLLYDKGQEVVLKNM